MDILYTALAVIIAVFFIWLIIKVFATSIKWAFKLLINAILGFVMLFIFNFLGGFIGLSISVSWLSAIIAGIFGIPGIIILLIIEIFFM